VLSVNNSHEPHGKLVLAVIANGGAFKLLLYATKSQPAAVIALTRDFKVALQKSNYCAFYDERRQLWSVLLETEELVASFAASVALVKVLMGGERVAQELRFNEGEGGGVVAVVVESGDSVEVEVALRVLEEGSLGPQVGGEGPRVQKARLGKGKLPQVIVCSFF